MKIFTLLALGLSCFTLNSYAQTGNIGIGTTTPNPKAILDITSTEKGLMIPRLTETQRDVLQQPNIANSDLNGLLIYNITANKFNVWKDNKWEEIGSGIKGDNGAAWSNGNLNPPVAASEPANSKDGDYYLNNGSATVFNRQAGTWIEVANLATGIVGPIGPAGSQWYNGTLNPPTVANEPSGINAGDLYLNNATGGVFKRQANGTWTNIANLTTGILGPQGPQGAQGIKGDKGDKGKTGNVGATGPQGLTGATGLTGTTGPQGATGLAGSTGPQGPVGAQGVKGDKGDTGSQGPVGLTGPAGPQGIQGIQGDKGDVGSQGPIGLTGPAGPQGIQGLQGDKGDVGSQGPIGLTGPIGDPGPTGAAGPKGDKGDPGNPGNEGPEGPAGSQGIQGPTGATGPAGPQGATGPSGPSGSASAWLRTGNGQGNTGGTIDPGTAVGKDFIGTTDAKELILASNRNEGIRIFANGQVRVGLAGSNINTIYKNSIPADLPSIGASASFKQSFTITGIGTGATVAVSPVSELPDGLLIAYVRVVSTNTVEVKFTNVSALGIDLPLTTFNFTATE